MHINNTRVGSHNDSHYEKKKKTMHARRKSFNGFWDFFFC